MHNAIITNIETFRVIRYEDFCEDIRSNARSLLHFFGFQMHPRVVNFIESHTHSDKGGVSSTFRDSKNAPYHWRHELSLEEVLDIQHKCDKALRLWGYKTANTPKELENLQPLLKYHFWDGERTFFPAAVIFFVWFFHLALPILVVIDI